MSIPILMTKFVADAMCRRVEFIDSDASVLEAIEKVVLKQIGALVIMENGKPSGVVTLRDIVLRCLAKGLDPRDVKVSEIASKPLITVKEYTPIDEVPRLLEKHKITRVFVEENGSIVGYVSLLELLPVYLRDIIGLRRPSP